MCVTPASGASFQRRPIVDEESYHTTEAGITAAHWVKLSRDDQGWFHAQHSTDGLTWADVNDGAGGDSSAQIGMQTEVYVGLALTSHNAAATCEAVFSNVTIEFPPLDTGSVPPGWTNQDIGILSNDAEQMYVAVEDSVGHSSISLHEDPNAATIDSWQEWNIDMNDFRDDDVQLDSIKKLAIGFGNRGEQTIANGGTPGGSGMVFFDDIRLYRARFFEDLLPPWPPDFYRDGVINYLDLDVLTNNWLISTWDVTPQNPGTTNLVAWYRFENNYQDSAGTNHGDPCGAPVFNSTDYREGSYSIELDGDDYVVTDANATDLGIAGNAAKSVTAWALTRSFNNGGIFDMGNYSAGQNFCLRTQTTDNLWRTQLWGATTHDIDFTYDSLDKWVHFALVHEPNETTVYADGHLVTQAERVLDTGDNVPFRVGLYSTGDYFDGQIDDVRVYNRALSQGEAGYLAGKTTGTYTQQLYLLLTPPDPNINLYDDGTIDFKDYDRLADVWGDEQLWPQW
jgi:hypothetical protein